MPAEYKSSTETICFSPPQKERKKELELQLSLTNNGVDFSSSNTTFKYQTISIESMSPLSRTTTGRTPIHIQVKGTNETSYSLSLHNILCRFLDKIVVASNIFVGKSSSLLVVLCVCPPIQFAGQVLVDISYNYGRD